MTYQHLTEFLTLGVKMTNGAKFGYLKDKYLKHGYETENDHIVLGVKYN